MDYTAIFYAILHETSFFHYYFYKKYLLDLKNQIAIEIHSLEKQHIHQFLADHPIDIENPRYPCFITADYIVISPSKSDYQIVLKINKALAYTNTKAQPLPHPFTSLHPYNNLTCILKKPIHPYSHVLFINILTNQSLETPEWKKQILKIIRTVFCQTICYFYQWEYHQYYILIQDATEIEIYQYCKQLKVQFNNYSKIYVMPRFLLMECDNFLTIQESLNAIKQYFLTAPFNPYLLVTKIATLDSIPPS